MVLRKEVNKILELCDEVKEDYGITLLVYGKEGTGKSYILDEVMKILQSKGILCLKERLQESNPMIFSKIVEQSRKHVSEMANGGILSYFISSTEPFSTAENTFLKLTESLTILVTSQQVFIALDDLDLCEENSLNLFYRVGRFISNKNIMLVATLEERINSTYFQNIYTSLKKASNMIELEIEPFTKEEMKDVLKERGYTIPSYIADNIYSDSGGYPSTVFKILKDQEKLGNIGPEKIWIGHYLRNETERLEEDIKNKIENLNIEYKEVINNIAILENVANFDILEYLTNFDELKLSEILDRLIYYEIVLEDAEFFKIVTRDLMRLIYESIDIKYRINIHKKYAEKLEREGGDIFSISEHFYLAGINDKALKYLKSAGLIYMKTERYNNALTSFLKAEAISDKKDSELMMYIGTVYRSLGDNKKSVEYLENSLKFAPEDRLNEIKIELADSYNSLGKFDAAVQYYTELLNILTDKKQIIRTYFGLYRIYDVKNEITKAREYVTYALKIAEEIDDVKSIADCYRFIGNIEYALVHLDLSKKNYEQALELYKNINNIRGLSRTYNNLANIYADTASSTTAIEYYEKAAYYCDMLGDENMMSIVYNNLAELSFQRSDLKLFLKYNEKAKNMSEITNDVIILNMSYILYCWYYISKGDFEEALDYYKKCAESYEKIEDKYSSYKMQYEIQYVTLMMTGQIDKKQMTRINEGLKNSLPEKAAVDILELDAMMNMLDLNFKNSLKSAKKLEKIANNNIDILWSLTSQFSSELFLGEHSKCIEIYDKIDRLIKSSGIEMVNTKRNKICTAYLKDKAKAALLFKDLDDFFDAFNLKFEKAQLYLHYGVLKLKYENDDSYLQRAVPFFESIKLKPYVSLANHYLNAQKQNPK
jgi:tetratricopeptide (TPR) repeat protein